MNMFLHELKAYRKSTLIWSFAMIAFAFLYLMMFSSISLDIAGMKKVLEGYPLGVRKALGLSIESFTTILGIYSFVFGYILLCGAIQAMNFGTSVVSKEMRDKTADFLLTKPVSRIQILTAKLLGVLVSLVITNIIYITITVIIALIINYKGVNVKIFIMISITLLFVQLIFMSLGVIVSVIFPKIKSVIAVSLCTVFSFFVINMFGSVIGDKAVRYITPFKFYDIAYITKNASYEAPFVIIEIVFVIIAIAASYVIYFKKDIHAV
jgi:ABC-2 type transport system permease protein